MQQVACTIYVTEIIYAKQLYIFEGEITSPSFFLLMPETILTDTRCMENVITDKSEFDAKMRGGLRSYEFRNIVNTTSINEYQSQDDIDFALSNYVNDTTEEEKAACYVLFVPRKKPGTESTYNDAIYVPLHKWICWMCDDYFATQHPRDPFAVEKVLRSRLDTLGKTCIKHVARIENLEYTVREYKDKVHSLEYRLRDATSKKKKTDTSTNTCEELQGEIARLKEDKENLLALFDNLNASYEALRKEHNNTLNQNNLQVEAAKGAQGNNTAQLLSQLLMLNLLFGGRAKRKR